MGKKHQKVMDFSNRNEENSLPLRCSLRLYREEAADAATWIRREKIGRRSAYKRLTPDDDNLITKLSPIASENDDSWQRDHRAKMPETR